MHRRFNTLLALLALNVGSLFIAGCGTSTPQTDDDTAGGDSASGSGEPRIAFISDRGGAFHLYTMNPDGSDLLQLSDTAVADMPFSVSNDGMQIIAVEATAAESSSPIPLVRIDADGDSEKRLTELPPAGMDVVHTTRNWQPGDTEALMQHEDICYAVPTGGGDAQERSPDECLIAQIRADGPDGNWAAVGGESLVVGEGADWDDYEEIDRVLPESAGDEGFAGIAYLALQIYGVMRPLWSPDGSRLAYIDGDANGAHGIAVIDPDGGNGKLVMQARGGVDMALPGDWSDDGRQLYFAGMNDDSAIHVIDVDGDGTETVLGGDGYAYKHPRWVIAARAPDREAGETRPTPDAEQAAANLADVPGRLLYQRGYQAGSYISNPDGSGEQLLVADSLTPAFTSVGRWMTFATKEEGTFEGTIVLFDTITGERREFGRGSDPVPSPDGSRIAHWELASLDEGSRLVIIDVATGQARAIYAEPAWEPEPPSWSPDGTKIAVFHETVSLADADHAAFEVVLITPARGETQVIAETTGGFLYSGPALWSPDGTKIAFDDTILRVADTNGGGTRDYDIEADSVAWSPDGKRLAARGIGIYLVDAESGDVERLTNDVGGCVCEPPAWSPDGEWLAYAGADGTLRVMHVESDTVIRPGNQAEDVRWLPQ